MKKFKYFEWHSVHGDIMTAEKKEKGKKHKKIVVFFNQEKFELETDTPTGAELYQIFNVPAGNKLFLDVKKPNEPDKFIPNDSTEIKVKNGDHFYDLPPGTVGWP